MSLRQAPAISTNLLRLVVLTLEPGDDALADILRDSGISPAEFLEDDGYLSWQQAHTVIGNILRVLYDGLFWARNLSEGGRERPLLVVMEEAHSYLGDDGSSAASIATRLR